MKIARFGTFEELSNQLKEIGENPRTITALYYFFGVYDEWRIAKENHTRQKTNKTREALKIATEKYEAVRITLSYASDWYTPLTPKDVNRESLLCLITRDLKYGIDYKYGYIHPYAIIDREA